jgi:hypothetical protein
LDLHTCVYSVGRASYIQDRYVADSCIYAFTMFYIGR